MTEDLPTEASASRPPGRRWITAPPPSIIWALGCVLAVVLVYVLRDLVLILLLSVTLAYLINPIVKIAESVAIKREVAVAVVYTGIGLGLFAMTYLLFPLLSDEINALSSNSAFLSDELDKAIDSIQNEIVAIYPTASRWLTTREVRYQKLNIFIDQQIMNIPALSGRLASVALAGALIPFFSYFFLRDNRRIVHFVLDRLAATHIETTVAVWCEINRIVGAYLRSLAIDGVVLGVLAALGLWIMGVNYPLLLGGVTAVANVVPYLGAIIGGAVTMVVAMIQFKSLAPLVKVLVFYFCLKVLNFVAIQPTAVAKGTHLHPALFIASVIAGGHIMGIIGMVVAVPVVTILQEGARLMLERRRYARAMTATEVIKAGQIQPYVC